MSDFLDGISLGLSPQDPFFEEMEVEILSTQEGNVAPGFPSDQALRDLVTDQWPSQAPEDVLLGASQLQLELSDGSSSGGDEKDNADLEGLLKDLNKVEEEEKLQEDVVPPQDEPMPPAPAPYVGSHPPPQSAPAPSWVDIMDQEVGEGTESHETVEALLVEQHALRQQHSLESLAAFRDSEVKVPGLDLGPLGKSLFLGHHLSPAAAFRPYQEVVGRVASHLHLRGDLQDALMATCRRDSFRTDFDHLPVFG